VLRIFTRCSFDFSKNNKMLTLINTNTMVPPISPVGLDYIVQTAGQADIDVDVLDLCLLDSPEQKLKDYFSAHSPELVGLSFRNVDDCYWPNARWFVPGLTRTVNKIRSLTDAAIVLGGIGFSIFAKRIVECTGADFGIRGDGEQAIVSLYNQLRGKRRFESVAGLIWRADGKTLENCPAWPGPLCLPVGRSVIDNLTYLKKGGQIGLETKRGCNRACLYCADPLAKGSKIRTREPSEIADEVEALLAQGVDVLHLCDSEFNVPATHALAVCEELIRRKLGQKLRWYSYMAVVPFDTGLAAALAKAGCAGIDFTGDSACPAMLKTYRQRHTSKELASAVRLCRQNGITVMIDLLLGGPGETAQTVAETIDFMKKINPDCVGAQLGVRIYPGSAMEKIVTAEGPLQTNPNIRRKYTGPVDFLKPTFYISRALGPRPDELVRQLIGSDKRFFAPGPESDDEQGQDSAVTDHNYNDNTELVNAIQNGARGAYWDILRKLRTG